MSKTAAKPLCKWTYSDWRRELAEGGLFNELRRAGFSKAAIDAAWPSWWSADVESSPSGRAELRFALARKLGLAPKPLLGERVEFVWKDEARFKHLSTQTKAELAILTSFGRSVGRSLLRGTREEYSAVGLDAGTIRRAILSGQNFVDLRSLVSACWALGIPTAHLRVFPGDTKAMHAMVVSNGVRCAVLLGRDASYPAPVAFTLAHELGHICLGHLAEAPALIDLEDPATASERDNQEVDADKFALSLLTGAPSPEITTDISHFNSTMLAAAVLDAAPLYGVEPGTLALCVGYNQNKWSVAMSALRLIYSEKKPVWREVNAIANQQLDWSGIGTDNAEFLMNVLGINAA